MVCLGAVIRGDTPHFDFVAGECASGIRRVNSTPVYLSCSGFSPRRNRAGDGAIRARASQQGLRGSDHSASRCWTCSSISRGLYVHREASLLQERRGRAEMVLPKGPLESPDDGALLRRGPGGQTKLRGGLQREHR